MNIVDTYPTLYRDHFVFIILISEKCDILKTDMKLVLNDSELYRDVAQW